MCIERAKLIIFFYLTLNNVENLSILSKALHQPFHNEKKFIYLHLATEKQSKLFNNNILKMRKILLTLFAALACIAAQAVPAIPTPQKVTQPDGTQLTVRIKGDEFHNYLTTVDGYTIVKTHNGYYNYATLVNDEIVPSKIVARDAQYRTPSDNAWLQATGKNLKSMAKVNEGKKLRAQRDNLPALKAVDYSNFHGLVILVNFSDAQFTRSDVQEFYTHMINDENYTGYTNEDGSSNAYGRCTGSVRDYFYDNSNGIFSPQFDVVGPVQVNYSVNDGNSAYNIFQSAVQKANQYVDFSQYDLNNDGAVDLIYFIYADSPSSSDSSSPNHIWPHRSSFYSYMKYDGKYIRDYACSAEYIYAKSSGIFDGIGTICHEFSHVLGLPDLYDTEEGDDATNGEAQHPGEWDLMAGGNYQNNARTPVAYSFYDRYSTGFANYQYITGEGEYSLSPIGTTGDGYILQTKQNKEIFLIENRQKTKWDAYAPGHGMVVVRMDSTNSSVWNSNAPNGNATRLYYEMLRAGHSKALQASSDPFPGSYGVTMLTNDNDPNLKTYAGKTSDYIFYNIHEDGDLIKFNVKLDGTFTTAVEDFEPMPATTSKTQTNVQGSLATWTFAKCNATTPADSLRNGEISVAMAKPSTLTMTSDVAYKTYQVSFDFYNPTNIDVKLQLYMSTDGGSTWTVQNNVLGNNFTISPPRNKSVICYPINTEVPARYRIACIAGSTSVAGYVDDFTIYHNGEIPAGITGDVNCDGSVNASDVTALYNYILNGDSTFLSSSDVNGDGSVNASDVTAVYNIILGL